jgi:hypothetical protein
MAALALSLSLSLSLSLALAAAAAPATPTWGTVLFSVAHGGARLDSADCTLFALPLAGGPPQPLFSLPSVPGARLPFAELKGIIFYALSNRQTGRVDLWSWDSAANRTALALAGLPDARALATDDESGLVWVVGCSTDGAGGARQVPLDSCESGEANVWAYDPRGGNASVQAIMQMPGNTLPVGLSVLFGASVATIVSAGSGVLMDAAALSPRHFNEKNITFAYNGVPTPDGAAGPSAASQGVAAVKYSPGFANNSWCTAGQPCCGIAWLAWNGVASYDMRSPSWGNIDCGPVAMNSDILGVLYSSALNGVGANALPAIAGTYGGSIGNAFVLWTLGAGDEIGDIKYSDSF